MYIGLHPFSKAGYSGLLFITGLPRPSSLKNVWNTIYADFDEHLYRQVTDDSVTKIPGFISVPSSLGEAMALESARSHCLRKFQKNFQNNMVIGLCAKHVSKEGQEKTLAFFHPAFIYAEANSKGEVICHSSKSPEPVWAGLEKSQTKALWIMSRAETQSVKDIELMSISKDRCLRLAPFLFLNERNTCFEFSLEGLQGEI